MREAEVGGQESWTLSLMCQTTQDREDRMLSVAPFPFRGNSIPAPDLPGPLSEAQTPFLLICDCGQLALSDFLGAIEASSLRWAIRVKVGWGKI